MTSPEQAGTALRRGWTTGACAAAATKAALTALLTGDFPDPVTIKLPKGQTPSFTLAYEKLEGDRATAGIVKDAGDDPDVTHGATILATIRRCNAPGITFAAGDGVGTVTKAGLPVAPGEPAINPVPRRMMADVIEEVASAHGVTGGFQVTIAIPDGAALAESTWNPRLGIVGGLSILGTTGIVNPFSCSAWIHSIHRGIDVARANGLDRIVASTGSTSEAAARALYPHLPIEATIDMGDFAGGVLKYLRAHPVPSLTLAGGFAKLSKLARGSLDLHSARSQVDLDWLANRSGEPLVARANTAAEALEHAPSLARTVCDEARERAIDALRGAPVDVEIVVVGRDGRVLARSG